MQQCGWGPGSPCDKGALCLIGKIVLPKRNQAALCKILASVTADVVTYYWHQSSGYLVDAILNLRYIGGSTNTADALRTCKDEQFTSFNGARLGVDKVVVVLTAE